MRNLIHLCDECNAKATKGRNVEELTVGTCPNVKCDDCGIIVDYEYHVYWEDAGNAENLKQVFQQ